MPIPAASLDSSNTSKRYLCRNSLLPLQEVGGAQLRQNRVREKNTETYLAPQFGILWRGRLGVACFASSGCVLTLTMLTF
jgi:hypothetical protein